MTNSVIAHRLHGMPCEPHLRWVLSLRLTLSGIREMRSRLRYFCLLSHVNYLFDDLPVSSLRMQ